MCFSRGGEEQRERQVKVSKARPRESHEYTSYSRIPRAADRPVQTPLGPHNYRTTQSSHVRPVPNFEEMHKTLQQQLEKVR